MSLSAKLEEMDTLVLQGQIVEAVRDFFADNARTEDFDGTITKNRDEMIGKMEGFLGAIARVNGITRHHAATGDGVSMSEFTFDFNMKDGSKVLWHEIIRRVWQDGKVIHEQYFKS